jgi:hypothetical protein
LVSFGVFDLLIIGQMGLFEVGIWCFLLILGQMGIFEVGIFRRLVAWVFSPDLDDELDEDPAWISPDTPALFPDLAGSLDLDDVHRPFLRIPYTVYNIRKKKNEEKNRSVPFLYVFLKKNKS